LKKFFLSLSFVLICTSCFAIKILHPGVKINGKKIDKRLYALSEEEVGKFLAWNETNKKLEKIVALKDEQIGFYKETIKDIKAKFDKMYERVVRLTKELNEVSRKREDDARTHKWRLRRAKQRGFTNGLGLGLIGGGVLGAKVEIKF